MKWLLLFFTLLPIVLSANSFVHQSGSTKEFTSGKSAYFTAKMIQEVKARRMKYLKSHKLSKNDFCYYLIKEQK